MELQAKLFEGMQWCFCLEDGTGFRSIPDVPERHLRRAVRLWIAEPNYRHPKSKRLMRALMPRFVCAMWGMRDGAIPASSSHGRKAVERVLFDEWPRLRERYMKQYESWLN